MSKPYVGQVLLPYDFILVSSAIPGSDITTEVDSYFVVEER